MADQVDVAVVGGGPAGASAAFFLAREGRSVVVLDKKTFPRDKTCGDGLTPRSIRVLQDMGLAVDARGWQRVAGVRIQGIPTPRTAPVPRTRRWCDYGLVVPRRVLDQAVLTNAEAAGATVRYGTTALRPVVEDGVVCGVVAAAGDRHVSIRARWLVCADGATGTLRRRLGRTHDPRYPVGVALRQYCAPGRQQLRWFDVHVDLRESWGLLPGYGWAFPVDDRAVNVGVGMLNTATGSGRISLHDHLDRFTRRLADQGIIDPDGPVRDRRGGRLFMGCSVWPPHGPGYVLVGDAAGMINPFTGEGIAYALETGRAAARHLQVALERNGHDLSAYGDELRKAYGGYYQVGRGLVTIIEDPKRMQRLVGLSTTTDRRLRFATTLLLNLADRPPRRLDQLGARSLVWLARLTRWNPPPPAPVMSSMDAAMEGPSLRRRSELSQAADDARRWPRDMR